MEKLQLHSKFMKITGENFMKNFIQQIAEKTFFLSASYIDDCLLVGENYNVCRSNVRATFEMSERAGLVIQPEK